MWIKQLETPSRQVVSCLRITEKGIILKTAEYDCFLWASSKQAKQITQALEAWKNNLGQGVELWIEPDKQVKQGFKVLPGKPVGYFQEKNSWLTENAEEAEEFNPFLLATQSSMATPPSPSLAPHTRAKAKKKAQALAEKTPLEALQEPSEQLYPPY